jgi:hypothetical protein
MKIITILSIALFLISCSTTTPIISSLPQCNVDEELLVECQAAEKNNSHKTYRELIINYQKDKQKLKDCKIRQRALATSLRVCNQNIKQLNKDIEVLNKRFSVP